MSKKDVQWVILMLFEGAIGVIYKKRMLVDTAGVLRFIKVLVWL